MVKEVISGRFETLRLLGEGGDSRVYLVQDTFEPGRRFALKKLSRSPARLALAEFRRLCSLTHPAIPAAHEVGVDPQDGAPYFTAEFVEGLDFLAGLRHRPLEFQLEAVADLLRTLEFLHRQGVIHRDLKPLNVLIRRADSAPRVHLIDFGLAQTDHENVELSGSVPYLAPELFSGHPAHAGSDLYSIGVMLYELWFGRHPFQASSPLEWVRAHQHEPVVLPEVQDVPRSLGRLVQRLLAKDPDTRYPRAAAVLADLSRISVRPLPAETRRSLLGRIRSLPRPSISEEVEALWQEELRTPGSVVLWVISDSRGRRHELLRDLRVTSLSTGRAPLPVPTPSARPLDFVNAQVRAVLGDDGGEASPGAELLESLPDLSCAVFVEDLHQRIEDDEYWLRLLLRQPVPLAVSCDRSPEEDALGRELLQGSREVLIVRDRSMTADELRAGFPDWLGLPLSEELAAFLDLESGADSSRLIETLTYLVDCDALGIERGEPTLNLAAARLAGAPDDLVSILRERVRLRSEQERSLLLALAVWEEPCSLRELQESMAEPLDPEMDWSGLVDAALVRMSAGEGGDRLQIGSRGVGPAVLSLLEADQIAAQHRRVARVLENGVGLVGVGGRLARHRLLGDPCDASVRGALEMAEALLQADRVRESQALLDELAAVEHHASFEGWELFLRGQVCLKLGSTQEAAELLGRAAEATRDSDLGRDVLKELARAEERMGDAAAALRTLERASAPGNPGGDLLARRAFLLYRQGRLEEARRCCEEADRILPPEPSQDRVRTHNTLGLIEFSAGAVASARHQFRRSIELSAEAGRPTWKAIAQHNLARLEESCGQFREAVNLFLEGQRLMEKYGDRQMAAALSTTLAWSLFQCGQLAEAKAELERSREEMQLNRLGGQHQRPIASLQALTAMAEGELEVALSEARRAVELARSQGDPGARLRTEVIQQQVLCRLGDRELARQHVVTVRPVAQAAGSEEAREQQAVLEYLFAAWLGTDEDRQAALEFRVPEPGPLLRRVTLGVRRTRLLLRSGRGREALQLADDLARCMEGTDLVDRAALVRAHALAARHALGDESGAFPEAGPVERLVASLHPGGYTAQRAECLYWLGVATSNQARLLEAQGLAAKIRHAPLATWIEEALEQFGGSDEDELDMQSRKRLRSLERLAEVTKAINREFEGEQLLRMVLDHAVELTGARRGFLILIKGGKLSIPAARNIEATDIENPEFSVSSSVARTVAMEGQSYLASDVKADERFRHSSSISQLRLQSILCVPLHGREGVIGAIYLDDTTRVDRFDGDDLRVVENLSEHASIALEKAELLQINVDRHQEVLRSKKEIERLNRQLERTVQAQAQELIEVKQSLRATQAELSLKYDYPSIVTRSPRMRDVLKIIDRITDSSYPVYLYGESGTGKELIAGSIHRNGPRSRGPYFSINCASMSPTLIETELFGHVKGSFTGADRDKPGYFELADGGILFLDEISDASPELQSKLLRAIQFGEVMRVGSEEVRRVDVMVISASNRDLQRQVQEGQFREDLYYRVAVHRVEIPPLRERREDIPVLLEHFLNKYSEQHGVPRLRFQKGALRRMVDYHWPGNVRELENCVIDLMVQCSDEGEVPEERLPEKLRMAYSAGQSAQQEDGKGLRARLEEYERGAIVQALERHGGNRSRAAKELRMSERNLYKKLKKYDLISGPEAREPSVD